MLEDKRVDFGLDDLHERLVALVFDLERMILHLFVPSEEFIENGECSPGNLLWDVLPEEGVPLASSDLAVPLTVQRPNDVRRALHLQHFRDACYGSGESAAPRRVSENGAIALEKTIDVIF